MQSPDQRLLESDLASAEFRAGATHQRSDLFLRLSRHERVQAGVADWHLRG